MQTVGQRVNDYYHQHQEYLLRCYPGLSAKRLEEEYCIFFDLEASALKLIDDDLFWKQIQNSYPLEYINNQAYFYRSSFFVNQDVLIPRSETELLVEKTLDAIKTTHKDQIEIAEVGTGSFALGLSVLIDSKKNLCFTGGDICEKALEVSNINLYRLSQKISPQHKVKLLKSDRLDKFSNTYDIIVSNPPYIREKEDIMGVHDQTLRYEPHKSLFLPDESFLSWFEDFFKQASDKLNQGGVFLMEGHEDSLLHLEKIALKYFTNIRVDHDYTNRNRFLSCYKN